MNKSNEYVYDYEVIIKSKDTEIKELREANIILQQKVDDLKMDIQYLEDLLEAKEDKWKHIG